MHVSLRTVIIDNDAPCGSGWWDTEGAGGRSGEGVYSEECGIAEKAQDSRAVLL